MSTSLRVATARPYDVVVGHGVHDQLAALLGDDVARVGLIHSDALHDTARAIRRALESTGREVHLIEVPDGEKAKTTDVLSFCWSVLGQAAFTRSDAIVGVGGGATTDLAGFVAATWLRGVRLVTVPTTVLGMVDAAVGGKTGINTPEGKNLVGAFHEPDGVLCDLDILTSLPPTEVRSGLAEVIKCGFIADPTILELIERNPESALDPADPAMETLISKGIAVKAGTVAGDLTESGSFTGGGIGREALNYGHTLGHAIELHERYSFRHGAAVAIGMVFVAELARLAGRVDADLVARHRSVLDMVGLPTTYKPGVWDELHAAMRLDKKSRGKQLRFVVLDGLAAPSILTGPDDALLTAAYAEIVQ